MVPLGWQGRLDESSTGEGVVLVCQEFLALWKPEELAELPATCRPKTIFDAEEVTTYALRLIRQLGTGDRATDPMLHRMTTFFTRAALRLARMAAPLPDPSSDKGNSRSPPS